MPDLLQRLHSDEPHVPWQWSIGMFILSMVGTRPDQEGRRRGRSSANDLAHA